MKNTKFMSINYLIVSMRKLTMKKHSTNLSASIRTSSFKAKASTLNSWRHSIETSSSLACARIWSKAHSIWPTQETTWRWQTRKSSDLINRAPTCQRSKIWIGNSKFRKNSRRPSDKSKTKRMGRNSTLRLIKIWIHKTKIQILTSIFNSFRRSKPTKWGQRTSRR